ncbi:hypothetical protein R6L23_15445 [Streptomyces sp. SR27]|uniref:hypothetical protein n=1 Tax=Streptomyces sp. SR27 TaxID=3076630 RepID=UPI00295B8E0B|nr:hypothetical protein [Streptomyces sp. SR27]MDV9189591.1 hypothetical protein [Streptomyces sp. SR27]
MNEGDEPAGGVIRTHRLNPPLKVTDTSERTAVRGDVVRSEYGTVEPGQKVRGYLQDAIPADLSGTVQIAGRVTWAAQGRPVPLRPDGPAFPVE